MYLLSIASGSSGNCLCVGSDSTHLLVDAGISGKRIESGLAGEDLTARDLSGILVTHEHIDHVGGLGVMARRYSLPLYTTPGTRDALLSMEQRVGKIDPSLFHLIRPEEDFMIGDLLIRPVRISHDAAEPVAYILRQNDRSVGICTDLGTFEESLAAQFQDLDTLFLEANHDVRMLEAGPYPYALKRRILGDRGHLSNDAAGQLLCRLVHDKLRHVILGHLSKENNLPELAYETVRLSVTMDEACPYEASDFHFHVARRDQPMPMLCW